MTSCSWATASTCSPTSTCCIVPQQFLDLPYLLAFLGAGAMALHPSMRELTEPGPATQLTASTGRAALVAGALLVTAVLTRVPAVHRGGPIVIWSCSSR